ncbi:MAG: M48 family metallopeptidase [Thermoproteota archaeon]
MKDEMDNKTTIVFTIDTEVSQLDYLNLVEFIFKNYLLPNANYFTNMMRKISDEGYLLYFTFLDSEKRWYVDVQMSIERPIRVSMVLSSSEVPEDHLRWLRNNLISVIRFFEERYRKAALYFAWVEGEEIMPERFEEGSKDIVSKMFSESMLLLFIAFTMLSLFLFMILGEYAPLILVAMQFVVILFSDKIVGKMGDWHITQKNPYIHIFSYRMPAHEYRSFLSKKGKEMLSKIKKEIYERTLVIGKAIDYETCLEVFSKNGLRCDVENISTKRVNVYEVVKEAAEKFNLPIPKIVVSNAVMPNAAASGPWPSRGIILITTGLLGQLDEEELLSVLGHEFSHLRGRDPLVLFLLTSGEYLLRFYVFWPFLFFFGYIYIFLALGAVYFIAKFFESKADLESAIRIGNPKTLASALRKIGFRRLYLEARRGYAFQEWIGWDPHPPVYFRVARLESLEEPVKIKHPLIRSIKDNIRGFLEIIG